MELRPLDLSNDWYDPLDSKDWHNTPPIIPQYVEKIQKTITDITSSYNSLDKEFI